MTYDEFISAGLALCAGRGVTLGQGRELTAIVRLLVPQAEHDDATAGVTDVDILRRALRWEMGDMAWDNYPAKAEALLRRLYDIR